MSTTVVSASASSVALLLNSASAAAPVPQPSPVPGVTLPAATEACLSTDAGVVATLSGGAPAADSTTQLYDNLAALSVSAGAPASGAGAPAALPAADPATAAIDVNAAWASVLQTNPALAPEAAQMGLDTGIIDTLA